MKKRLLGILLCLVVLTGLLPTAAFARSESTKAIQLGISGIEGYDSANGYNYIYFGSWTAPDGKSSYSPTGPIKWRVLDTKTNMDGSTDGDGLFLMTDALFAAGGLGDVRFHYNYHYDEKSGKYFKGNDCTAINHTNCLELNAWQQSDAQTWCNDFYCSNLTSLEQSAVLPTTKSDKAFTSSTKYKIPFSASENILNGDKVFFLSAQEVENKDYGFVNDEDRIAYYGSSAARWWLRSPYAHYTLSAGVVYEDGMLYFESAGVNNAARPAFNLNPLAVMFVSPAQNGKNISSLTLASVDDYTGNEWKLTLSDNSRSFIADAASGAALTKEYGYSDWTIDIDYSGAEQGENEYVSAMLCDSEGNVLYYGSIAQNSASGKASVKIPDNLSIGSYTLKVFNEQINENYESDYASNFQNISLTVTPETYTVRFDANGGSGSMPDVSGVYGKYVLPKCDFSAPDDTLEFDKWVKDEGFYYPGEEMTVSDNITLKATWKKITYHITITDKNGNKVQITPSNCKDVLGDGTVSYTPPVVDSTKTYTIAEIEKALLEGGSVDGIQFSVLTLKNANLQQIYFENFDYPYEADASEKTMADLFRFPILKLEGDNVITNTDEYKPGIRVYVGMIVEGDGSLSVNSNGDECNALRYGDGGVYLQRSGSVTLRAHSRGIYQAEPIGIIFMGGKLTIQAGNSDDPYSGAITMFNHFDMADNATLLLGDSPEINCVKITLPNEDETWNDAIIRQWRDVGSENNIPHYLQLTSSYSVKLNANGGIISEGKNVTEYTYGEGASLPTADDMSYKAHTFKGWYDSELLTVAPVTEIKNNEIGNKQYWAKWEINQYTLTIKPENGEADIIIKQDYGTPITSPTLTKKGCTFNGWDKTFPTTMPDEDITITAQWIDFEAPTGEIKIAENVWRTFLNNVTFGLFFNDTQTVTVTASDNSGDEVTIEYLMSDKELAETDLAAMTFTSYTNSFNIDPDNEYIIYAKLTDTSGNVAYINTSGIVLDSTAPVISGIENGKTYNEAQTVTVNEKYIDSVTVNGKTITLDSDNRFTLSPAKGEQTVVVTDKAGNKTTVSVTVKLPSPKTGDNSKIMLWAILLFAGGGVIASIVYGRKKKHTDK